MPWEEWCDESNPINKEQKHQDDLESYKKGDVVI